LAKFSTLKEGSFASKHDIALYFYITLGFDLLAKIWKQLAQKLCC